MKVTAETLRRIAAMPEQAMAAALLLLAEQLEGDEVRKAGAARRQAEYADRKRSRQNDVSADVRMISVSHQPHVSLTSDASRVDNLSSLSESIETVSNPLVIPPAKPTRPSEPPSFAAFWSTYPKRAGDRDRKAALKAFVAAIKRASPDDIIAGAARYAAHCDHTGKTGTEFVRQARTWLNADGWNEPYEISRSVTNGSSIRDTWTVASAVLAEQDRLEGICREGGEDDLRTVSEPQGWAGIPRRIGELPS